jgi:hypothetical protein
MAKKSKKTSKVVDVKKAAANDKPEVQVEATTAPATAAVTAPVAKEVVIRKGDSAVQKGAKYAVMAGRPSKQAVTAVFGKAGYALSWIQRAEKMGVDPANLAARFKAEPQEVKVEWELAHPIVVKAAAAPKDEIAKGATVTSTRKVVDPLATVTPVAG